MSWPTPQEYNEAIQTPAISFSDPDLRKGEVALTPIGIPKAMTGAFASVYKLNTANGDWAVRCFLNNRPEQKERYEKISQHVLMDNLKYTVEFHYLEEGIKVRGKWYPILKMNWITGHTFEAYLLNNYRNRAKVLELKEEFANMAFGLDEAGMAHGDLQHGNMMVAESNQIDLKLIDYDAIFVPTLLGKNSLEIGHPNYQHPLRSETNYDTTVDNFSCWLIDHSLEMISIDPDLFTDFAGGDECILFRQKDLVSPEDSRVFNTLLNHSSERVQELTTTIIRMLWARPEMVPELHKPLELQLLPRIKPEAQEVSADTTTLSNISDGTRFHNDHNIDWTNPEEETYASELRGSKLNFKQATAKALKGVLDKSGKKLFPRFWIMAKLRQGNELFNDGNYEKACQFYLLAFQKALEFADQKKYDSENLQYTTEDSRLALLALVSEKLAYTFSLLKRHKLATNYFFVTHKNNKLLMRPAGLAVPRSAFYLAVNRYLRGDSEAAYSLFKEEKELLPSLPFIIKEDSYPELKYNQEVLTMLYGLKEQMDSWGMYDEFRDVAPAICFLHEKLADETSIKMDWKAVYVHLYIADQEYINDSYESVIDSYKRIKELITGIYRRENSIPEEEDVDFNSFEELLEAGMIMDAKNVATNSLNYLKLVHDHYRLDLEEFLEKNHKLLEYRKKKSLIFLINKMKNDQYNEPLNFIKLFEITLRNEASKLRSVLRDILIESGTDEEITEYIEYLAGDTRLEALNKFFTDFTAKTGDHRGLKIIRKLSKSTLNKGDKVFQQAILKSGKTKDVFGHLAALNSQSATIDFLVKYIRVNDAEAVVNLLSLLMSSGDIELIKELFNNHFNLMMDVFENIKTMEATVNFLLMLMKTKGIAYVKAISKELVSPHNPDATRDLVHFAALKDSMEADQIIFLVYLDSSQKIQSYIVTDLAENRYFRNLKRIYYLFCEKQDLNSIATLEFHTKVATRISLNESPVKHMLLDDYFETVSKVCINLINSGDEYDYDSFEKALERKIESILETRYGNSTPKG